MDGCKKSKITHLKEVAPAGYSIQRTPKEALEEAVGLLKGEGFEAEGVMVIIFDENAEGSPYRWIQGGGMTFAEMLWHTCQFKEAILSERLTEDF